MKITKCLIGIIYCDLMILKNRIRSRFQSIRIKFSEYRFHKTMKKYNISKEDSMKILNKLKQKAKSSN